MTGVITTVVADRGCAFVQTPRGDALLHADGYKGRWPPRPGERVLFELTHFPNGLRAMHCRPVASTKDA